jgi:hypothetical protein
MPTDAPSPPAPSRGPALPTALAVLALVVAVPLLWVAVGELRDHRDARQIPLQLAGSRAAACRIIQPDAAGCPVPEAAAGRYRSAVRGDGWLVAGYVLAGLGVFGLCARLLYGSGARRVARWCLGGVLLARGGARRREPGPAGRPRRPGPAGRRRQRVRGRVLAGRAQVRRRRPAAAGVRGPRGGAARPPGHAAVQDPPPRPRRPRDRRRRRAPARDGPAARHHPAPAVARRLHGHGLGHRRATPAMTSSSSYTPRGPTTRPGSAAPAPGRPRRRTTGATPAGCRRAGRRPRSASAPRAAGSARPRSPWGRSRRCARRSCPGPATWSRCRAVGT